MSTHKSFFPVKDGVVCRCPYCAAEFAWPPEKMACPKCGRTVRPPWGYSSADKSAKREALKRIRRETESASAKLQPVFDAKALRKPSILFFILAVMMAVGMVLLQTSQKNRVSPERRKQNKLMLTINDLEVYAAALAHYKIDTGEYPSYSDGGLLSLISNPGKSTWNGPYISNICRDGWGRPYFYDRTNGIPVLISAGPDRTYNTSDDLITPLEMFKAHPNFVPAAEQSNRTARPLHDIRVKIGR